MKIQPYVLTENGKIFDITLNEGHISFHMIDFTEDEVNELLDSIKTQIRLNKQIYQSLSERVKNNET